MKEYKQNSIKINKWHLFLVYLRSHFIMAVWNFERMLNLGFLYSLVPVIRVLNKNYENRKNAITRHLVFFNTHPYFASYVLGMVIRKEEKLSNVKEVNEKREIETSIQTTKTALMGPLGALGDSLFWGSLRPFLTLLSVVLTILLWEENYLCNLLGLILFLTVYNSAHFYIRFFGLIQGYRYSESVVEKIKSMKIPNIVEKIRTAGVIIIGLFLGFISSLLLKKERIGMITVETLKNTQVLVYTFLIILLPILFVYGLKKKISVTKLLIYGIALIYSVSFLF